MLSLVALVVLAGCGSRSAHQEVPAHTNDDSEPVAEKLQAPVILLHGGAGTITHESMQNGLDVQYRNALDSAISLGYAILENGGTALTAVEQTIMFLEDHPLFNAGKGAVLNAEGSVELDASIMDGSNLKAGAVAGVTTVKNPIMLARLVKDSTRHVLLKGRGAESFAAAMHVPLRNPEYFLTPKTRKIREERITKLHKLGTVGCVALDKNHNLAAGTSTGGMDMKKYGRVGDSPIIGAGTYAKNSTCAVSCTGHGEYFIRNVVAYDMSALMEYKGYKVQQAARELIFNKLLSQKALGGLIALDYQGNIAIEYNTPGMFWAFCSASGKKMVGMFAEDQKPENALMASE